MSPIGYALFLALAPAPAPAAPPVGEALASAARYCEAAVTERRTPPPLPAGAAVAPEGAVPDLIRRFAATRPMTRMFGVEAYVRFPAANGQVWVVRAGQSVTCDIEVTAVPGGVAALSETFVRSLPAKGWEVLSSLAATETRPLWHHTLVKRVPKPDSPDFGLRLQVQGLHPSASTEDGTQMELSFTGGDNFQFGTSHR